MERSARVEIISDSWQGCLIPKRFLGRPGNEGCLARRVKEGTIKRDRTPEDPSTWAAMKIDVRLVAHGRPARGTSWACGCSLLRNCTERFRQSIHMEKCWDIARKGRERVGWRAYTKKVVGVIHGFWNHTVDWLPGERRLDGEFNGA